MAKAAAAYKRSAELAGDTDADLDGKADDDATARGGTDDDTGDDDDERDDRSKTQKELDEIRARNDIDDDDDEDGDVEEKARRLGWVPESEWSSKKPWVPAKEFLERSYRNRGLYKGSLDKLQKQVDDLTEQNAELVRRSDESGKVLRNIWGKFKSAEKDGYNRAFRDLEKQRRKAIEDGDVEKVDQLEKRQAELKKPTEDDDTGQDDGDGKDDRTKARDEVRRDPVMARWLEQNPWFDEHYELAQAAQGIHGGLKKKHPNWSLQQNLEEVARQIKERFPDFFENDADDRRRRDTVDTNTRRSRSDRERGGKKGRRFSDLPPDAQAACRQLQRTIEGYTVQEYLDDYEWDD